MRSGYYKSPEGIPTKSVRWLRVEKRWWSGFTREPDLEGRPCLPWVSKYTAVLTPEQCRSIRSTTTLPRIFGTVQTVVGLLSGEFTRPVPPTLAATEHAAQFIDFITGSPTGFT